MSESFPTFKIGVLLGSARPNGNCRGLEAWLYQRMHQSASSSCHFELVNIYPNAPIHPLGPVTEDVIPALIGADAPYGSENVNEWSKLVTSCHGFIILTPQYNWGYPGDLKNALDHLYFEWRNKPVAVVTYGGHGGGKCGEQLRQVLSGLRMKVIEQVVSITLPSEYIRESNRLTPEQFSSSAGTSAAFEFLTEAEEALARAIDELTTALKAS